jgi:DNA-binding NarL/FixJ family response regulator
VRLLIIADNLLAAEAIRRELRHAPAFAVLGYVDGRQAVGATVAEAMPDVVVVHEMASPERTVQRVREVRAAAPAAKVALLTAQMEPAALAESVAAGADAAICKRVQPGALALLLREVVRGNVFHAFTPAAPERRATEAAHLTAREREILALVAAGRSNARIAAELWVTEQTIKFHLSNVYRKLGVANRTEASHYAHVHELLDAAPAMATRRAPAPVAAAA